METNDYKCPSCEATVPQGYKFCNQCGKSLTDFINKPNNVTAEGNIEISDNNLPHKSSITTKTVTIFCRHCGSSLKYEDIFCQSCGFRPLTENNYCQECGATTKLNQEICIECKSILRNVKLINHFGGPYNTDFFNAELWKDKTTNMKDTYYTDEFTEILNSNELYKGKWNWTAFLFGPLWALTKGIWLAPLVNFVFIFTVAFQFPGDFSEFIALFIEVIYAFVFGTRGNYMYYSSYVKSKQIPF